MSGSDGYGDWLKRQQRDAERQVRGEKPRKLEWPNVPKAEAEHAAQIERQLKERPRFNGPVPNPPKNGAEFERPPPGQRFATWPNEDRVHQLRWDIYLTTTERGQKIAAGMEQRHDRENAAREKKGLPPLPDDLKYKPRASEPDWVRNLREDKEVLARKPSGRMNEILKDVKAAHTPPQPKQKQFDPVKDIGKELSALAHVVSGLKPETRREIARWEQQWRGKDGRAATITSERRRDIIDIHSRNDVHITRSIGLQLAALAPRDREAVHKAEEHLNRLRRDQTQKH